MKGEKYFFKEPERERENKMDSNMKEMVISVGKVTLFWAR